MPSKKKKYNARFPAGRIKKIMQTDEEVGKVAQAVPIIISRTLELFVHSLLTKTMQITSAKNAKTLSPSHMKQCILSESRFDFLKDLVKSLPDVSGPDDEVPTPPATPAPALQTNVTNIAMYANVMQHSNLERQRQLDLSNETNANHRGTRNNGSSEASNVKPTNQDVTATVVSQMPQFQISVPAAYQGSISQPNFYTEVNPSNLSENASASRPLSYFTQTASIDEDYDT